MITRHEQLIAYLATLAALLIIYIVTITMGAQFPAIIGKIETFGLGTITGGLIGILRIPTQRNVHVDNRLNDPVPTIETPTDEKET